MSEITSLQNVGHGSSKCQKMISEVVYLVQLVSDKTEAYERLWFNPTSRKSKDGFVLTGRFDSDNGKENVFVTCPRDDNSDPSKCRYTCRCNP